MNLNKREHNPKSRIFCQTFRHNKNLNAWYKLTMEPYLFFWCAIFFFCNNKFSVFQILVFFANYLQDSYQQREFYQLSYPAAISEYEHVKSVALAIKEISDADEFTWSRYV